MTEFLVFKLSGKTRRVTRNGREYLVAPLTMIVSGVLAGSNGPLFYPADEIERSADDWNDIPIVAYHPTNSGGRPVSGRTPSVLDARKIGRVYGAGATNGRLRAEGWFDVEATRRVDPRILDSLERGERIGLSTGLQTENEEHESRSHNGVAYSRTARNYRPDHLAILPDEVGACSISDGCGVLVNSTAWRPAGPISLPALTANCSCEKWVATEGWMMVPQLLDNSPPAGAWSEFTTNPYPNEHAARMAHPGKFKKDSFRRKEISPGVSVILAKRPGKDKMEIQAYRFKASKFTAAAARRWLKDHDVTPIMFEKASGQSNNASSGVNDMVPLPAPPTPEAAWSSNAVPKDVSFDELMHEVWGAFREAHPTRYDAKTGYPQDPCYLVSVFDGYVIYQENQELYREGYSVVGGEVSMDGNPERVERVTKYVKVTSNGSPWPHDFLEVNVPKLKDNERRAIIDELTANCDCWKHQGDREILEGFNDDKLASLKAGFEKEKQAVAVANAAVAGFSDGGSAYRVNPETGKWEKGLVQSSDNAARPAGGARKKAQDPPEEDDEEDDDEEGRAPARRRKAQNRLDDDPPPRKPKRPQTMDELLRSDLLTPEMRGMLANAQEVELREKSRVVEQLLANASILPADYKAQHERLIKRPLQDLYNDLALVPKPQPAEESERGQAGPRGGGRAGAGRAANSRAAADEDMLAVPTMDWQELGAAGRQQGQEEQSPRGRPVAANAAGDDLNYDTEEEWLSKAPAHVRNTYQNAAAIEARERGKLVDDLVANISDEEAEQRLRQRLMNKPLEELRELQALAPRRDQVRPSYFGSAGSLPLAGNAAAGAGRGAAANDVNEDVLPLPSINWQEESRRNSRQG